MTERNEYYPYGSVAASAVSQETGNHYKFTGKEADAENNLQYFGARYYDNRVDKFDSIDPFMLQIASDQRVQEKTGSKLKQLLADPQSLNNYAYSRNNPVILIDPDGKWWKDVITGRQSFADFNVELGQAAQQMYDTSGVWKNAMDHPVATGIVVGVVGGAAAAGVSVVLGGSVTCGIICGSGGSSITILGASQADKASKILESGRGWSPGKIADSAKNLVEHFEKHASEIGAKNISQYYQKANDFIQNGYTNIFKEGADKVYYNVNNNLSAILDSNGNIKTFYRVENLNKINSYLERIANMK